MTKDIVGRRRELLAHARDARALALTPNCRKCNDTGYVAIRSRDGVYAFPGPVPDDAKGYADADCWYCDSGRPPESRRRTDMTKDIVGRRVKPLDWGDTHAERGIHMQARTPFGRYILIRGTGFRFEAQGPGGFKQALKSEEAAKAAAQADYETRILSALETLSPPDGVGLETSAQERDQWRYSVNPFTVEDKERLLRDFNRIVARLLSSNLDRQEVEAAIAAEKARGDGLDSELDTANREIANLGRRMRGYHERAEAAEATIAERDRRIAEAVNELHCCDDLPLNIGLAEGIAALREARDAARALLSGQQDTATETQE